MNFKKCTYDNFGLDEYYPITELGELMSEETGKYLTKYGQFDLIISSPRDRCLQTATIMAKHMGYEREIDTSDLLLESNAGKLNFMPFDKIDKFISKNKKLAILKKNIEEEQNEFLKISLNEKTDVKTLDKNYRKFLSDIVESKHQRSSWSSWSSHMDVDGIIWSVWRTYLNCLNCLISLMCCLFIGTFNFSIKRICVRSIQSNQPLSHAP
jgi:hypothetical protein